MRRVWVFVVVFLGSLSVGRPGDKPRPGPVAVSSGGVAASLLTSSDRAALTNGYATTRGNENLTLGSRTRQVPTLPAQGYTPSLYQDNPNIEVRVYRHAGVPSYIVQRAEREATAILRAA